MSKITAKRSLGLALLSIVQLTFVFGQIDFKISVRPDASTYSVYIRPDTTMMDADASTVTAQITVLAPTGSLQPTNLNSKKGAWIIGQSLIAPDENPQMDYFFFNLASATTDIPYVKGEEVEVFSFTNDLECTSSIMLLEHNSDPMFPDNSSNANVGHLIILNGTGSERNLYRRNYGIGTANCVAVLNRCFATYTLNLLEDQVTYQVAVLPEVDWISPFNTTSTAQVTMKVPTGSFNVANFQNLIQGANFAFNALYVAPSEDPDFDYISFGLISNNTQEITYSAQEETPLFTFENSISCNDLTIRMAISTDPFVVNNAQNANVANQLTTLGSGPDVAICDNSFYLKCVPSVDDGDGDNDGVPDELDLCNATPTGATVNVNGCSDSDGDGYFPGISPADPFFDTDDSVFCIPNNSFSECDNDNDGIANAIDNCPFSSPGAVVDENGCTDDDGDGFYPDAYPTSVQLDPDDTQPCIPSINILPCDDDGDGVANGIDQCPNTPADTPVNAEGCVDADNDGYFGDALSSSTLYDPDDTNPCIPQSSVAACEDDDNDGVPNGVDKCLLSTAGAVVNADGCTDDDGDGFFPDVEANAELFDPEDDNVCRPDGTHIDCSDDDGDGIPNDRDNCTNTTTGAQVNNLGCTDNDNDGYFPDVLASNPNYDPDDANPCIPDQNSTGCDDDDGDGVPNGIDLCVNTPPGAIITVTGCIDTDGDGFSPDADPSASNFDPDDTNPCSPDATNPACDDDGDGVPNGEDACPLTSPGAVVNVDGCTDADGDGNFPDVDPSFPNYDSDDNNRCLPTSLTLSLEATAAGCINAGDDLVIQAQVTGGDNNYSYVWQGPNGFASVTNNVVRTFTSEMRGKYILELSDVSGCSVVDSIIIGANQTPQALATNGGPICQGGIANLLGNSLQSQSVTYEWYNGDPDAVPPGQLVGTDQNIEVDSLDPGVHIFYLKTISTAGCGESEIVQSAIEVRERPTLSIEDIGTNVCPGNDLTINASNIPNAIYTWTGPNDFLSNLEDPTISNLNEEASGEYLLIVQRNGCDSDTTSVNITVGSDPLANDDFITVNPLQEDHVIPILVNDSIGIDNPFVSITEAPQSGSISFLNDTLIYQNKAGFYGNDEFKYMICNPGCADQCSEATVFVNVVDGNCDNIPNVITPNQDGINDQFVIPCVAQYSQSRLTVYNRWGDEVYRDGNYSNDWEGTWQNKNLPVGTYYYICEVNDGQGTVIRGYVFIQR